MEEIQKEFVPLRYQLYVDKNYNDLRRNKVILLGHVMEKNPAFQILQLEKKQKITEDLEKGCHNTALEKIALISNNTLMEAEQQNINSIYNSLVYNLASNLDKDSAVNSVVQSNLSERILSGEIPAINAGKLKSKEMNPALYIEWDKKMQASLSGSTASVKTSELYTCRKCKKNQCTIELSQRRCLDEGQSAIITCVFCGNRWSIS